MSTFRFARWSRLAVIAAVPLMGVTLLVVVWSTERAIGSASDTVVRGEADTIHAAVRGRLMAPGDEPPADRLSGVLDAESGAGLRYVLALDADDHAIAEAGDAGADVDEITRWVAATPPETPEQINGRVRVWYGRARGTPRPPPRDGHTFPAAVVIELEPQVADDLQTTAHWLMATGALAALTLSLLAAVLVRWSLRREGAVRATERERHLAQLGQMSAVLAHEIRNPLASLKGNAQLLAGALPAGEKVRAKADRVVEEAARLETLSNDLLAFARTGELRLVETDPAALLREAAAAVSPRIEVIVQDPPRTWRFDRERIREVLINVLENASEIGEGAVRAEVGRDGGALSFSIADTGPGIDAADLPHLFEPFFTRRTRGTGLGLAVAKRFVDLHGGTISAANLPAGGAVVRITLPRPS